MPEALIAAFLLSVSILGLLHYYQTLTQGFMRQWQVQQAWALAHAGIETYYASGKKPEFVEKGWEFQVISVSAGLSCEQVSVFVRSPLKYQAALHRLLCKAGM